jgi:Rad3-related DNA helicase
VSEIVIPDSPRDLGIPKDSWRDGQRETVREVLDAFLSGKKYVMLSAPTGAGKSVIAAAVQKLLARAGGSGEGRSVALTHTIQLQQQYIETLPDAAVITGRGNYDCDLPIDHIARLGFPRLSAEDAPCSTGDGCDSHLNRRGGCGYYSQFWDAADSPMVTMNYAYAARIMQQEWFSTGERDPQSGNKIVMRNPFRRSLLVADECHLAERAIVEAAGIKLNVKLLRELGIDLPHPATRQRVLEGRTYKEYETTGVWSAWARKVDDVVTEGIEHQEGRAEYLVAKKDERSMEELALVRVKTKRLRALSDALKVMANIDALRYDEWSIKRETFNGYPTNVVAQPLWGWTVAQESLWQWFDKVLLMSATPGDPAIERIKLGIPEDKFVFIEVPSVFPVKNRPVYFWPVAKLSYTSTDADWSQIARAIAQIAGSGQWAERKGLVHSGSKANATKLVAMLNALTGSQRFFTHGSAKGEAQAALELYKRSPDPLVMVTASFTTGLDLPYLIGWQVIAKVPYGSLADEMTARRRAFKDANGVDFGQRVYQSEAMNTVVQAAGRIVRAQDDTGPTFIVDANYAMLHRMAWKPAFYAEAYQQLSMAD